MKIINIKFVILFLFFVFGFFSQAQAASIYLDPADTTIAPGSTFSVQVKINPDDNYCINSGELIFDFSNNLYFKDFSVGNSIFSLWIDRPDNQSASIINRERRVKFSGGIPGGYCGQIPGDSGDSNILGEIIFEAGKLEDEEFSLAYIDVSSDSSIYLNDGQGTEDSLEVQGANIRIDSRVDASQDQWSLKLEEDDTIPEPFVITIDEYNGKKFAAFSTTDKQTGIDYYEILEARPEEINKTELTFIDKILGRKTYEPVWIVAKSPYYLEDQEMKSIIRVRAIDKAGNERVVECRDNKLKIAIANEKTKFTLLKYILPVLFVVLMIVFLWLFIKNKSRLGRIK